MSGPGWLTGLLAAVLLTVAAYNVTRLVAAPRWGRAAELDADGTHVVMGVAMAGMLAPGLSFAPPRLWQAVFAAAGAWFGYQYIRTRRGQELGPWRCPHPLPHLIECVAMVFMLALPAAAATTATGTVAMTGPLTGTAARFSPLTLLLALFMVGYVMWLGQQPDRPNPRHRNSNRHHNNDDQLPGPQVRRLLQDRHGRHHGLHADHDAVGASRRPDREAHARLFRQFGP